MSGVIEVDLFPADVDRADHPDVLKFKRLLQEAAKQYQSRLITFEVSEGTVSFAFDSDELTAEILKIFQEET